jgi:hypothetical protein
VLLDGLGLWGSFGFLGLVYAASVPGLAATARPRVIWAAGAAALVIGFGATPLSPLRLPAQNLREGERLLASVEGADGLRSACW